MSTRTPYDSLPAVSDKYPVGCSPFVHSEGSPESYYALLSNPHNFARETNCEIFQIQDGKTELKSGLSDDDMFQYISVRFKNEVSKHLNMQVANRGTRNHNIIKHLYTVSCELPEAS